MKLPGGTKSKITKNENGKDYFEATEVAFCKRCIQESCIHLVLINCLANY